MNHMIILTSFIYKFCPVNDTCAESPPVHTSVKVWGRVESSEVRRTEVRVCEKVSTYQTTTDLWQYCSNVSITAKQSLMFREQQHP